MDQYPSLEEPSPTGSVVHVSPQSLVSSATSTQRSDSGPGSPDITPKPLRILKPRPSRDSTLRRQSTWSTPLKRRLPSGRSTALLLETIPKRRSSAAAFDRRKRKCFRESPQSHASPTIRDTSRSSLSGSPIEIYENLIVQKQRDMDVRSRVYLSEDTETAKNYVCTKVLRPAANQPVPGKSPEHRTSNGGMDSEEIYSSPKPQQRARLQKRMPDRAVTIATDVMPSNPELLLSPTSIISSRGVRRAATTHGHHASKLHEISMQTSDSLPKETPGTIPTSADSENPSQRVPPTKRGGFLRSLNKLDFIGKSKSMVTIHNNDTETNLFRRLSQRISGEDRRRSGSSNGHTRTRSRSTTTSSAETDTNVSGEPEMNIKGTTTDRPLPRASTSPEDDHDKTDIIFPQKPSILTAKIDIVPELKRLEPDTEQSMWVAVDVTAGVFRPHGEQERSVPETDALDVVLCFDPFAFTLKSTLSSSRSIAVMIACLLDRTKDHLAIVGPSSRRLSSISECNVLCPLQPIDLTHITNVLMSVQKPRHNFTPTKTNIEEAMKVSVGLLSKPMANSRRGDPRRLRHIFLLCPTVCKVPSDLPDDIQVHIINPSMIPSKPAVQMNNGWQLHLPPSTTADEASMSDDDKYASDCLRKVLANARTGNLPGWLTDISVDVSAGPNCEIEHVLGDTRYHSLGPGQTTSIFARIKVSSLQSSPILDVNAANQTEHGFSSDYLHAQIVALLGETAEEILQVKVQYKHTLLPEDTVLSVEETSVVRRRICQSAWGPSMSGMDHSQEHNRALVYKRLGSFAAANRPPRRALDDLQELYRGDIQSHMDPTYLGLLIKELRHRARTMGKHDPTRDGRPRKGDSISSTHPTDELIRPLHRHTTRTSNCEDVISPMTLPPPPEQTKPSASPDEARKIWHEMRRDSRAQATTRRGGPHHHHRGWSDSSLLFVDKLSPLSSTTDAYDDFIWEITDKAIRNKRSLGVDTLRSFAFGGRVDSSGGGYFAPWL